MRLVAVVVVELRRFFVQSGIEDVVAKDNADPSVVVGPAGRRLSATLRAAHW
jgi:hypothetical protein